MMNRILLIIAISLLLVSCNNTKKREHTPGKTLRIISLVPSITKELIDLGATDNIIGTTTYSDLAKKDKNLIVGSAIQVNMEKVMLLKPDIVFAGGLTKPGNIKTFKQEGITVHRFLNPKSYDEMCRNFVEIGKILGKEERAKRIVAEAVRKLDSIRNTIPDREAGLKFFFQIGTNPVFAVIPGTFMNDYITMAKFSNIASDIKQGTISRETVLTRNPDVIFISTMGTFADEEKIIWESFKELSASANKKIFIIDSDLACSATVLSFVDAFEYIVNKTYN